MRNASALAPFRHRQYVVLWAATVLANTGTWMYSAAAGWLMTTLDPNPVMVAMVQVATTLPMFLFAMPAGALADILDTRRYLIAVEGGNIAFAVPMAAMSSMDAMTAWLLLAFTFLIEMGAALAAPAWQSIVPHLVPREDLPAAVAANSVGFNISRAIGPALGGVLAAAFGHAAPFWVNAFSNVGSIAALGFARPKRANRGGLPAERVMGAMRAGFRHARNNPPLRATLVRAASFFFFAAAYWALLPLVARDQVADGARLYGMLLGAIGLAAIAAAAVLPRVEAWMGADRLVVAAQVTTAAALVMFAFARSEPLAFAASALAGASWIAGVSRLNVSSQVALPDWVRARGLALHVAVSFGAMTLGSGLWGEVAHVWGLFAAQLLAAAGALAAIALTRRYRLLAGARLDLSPSMHWPTPVVSRDVEGNDGPVLITVEYRVERSNRMAWLDEAPALERQRRRNGAYAWEMFEDAADPGRFIEAFHVESWLEHLRQHERVTEADRAVEVRVRTLSREEPRVHHFLAASPVELHDSSKGNST